MPIRAERRQLTLVAQTSRRNGARSKRGSARRRERIGARPLRVVFPGYQTPCCPAQGSSIYSTVALYERVD